MITNNRVKKCKVTKIQIEIIGLIGIFTKYTWDKSAFLCERIPNST